MSSLNREQAELVSLDRFMRERVKNEIKRLKEKYAIQYPPLSYNRLLGDISCRIVMEFLNRHLPRGFKAVGPAYIWCLPIEYDILIVTENSKPRIYTNAYDPRYTHFIIEVKSRGIFPSKGGGEKGLRRAIKKVTDNLLAPRRIGFNHIKPMCLLIGEGKPKRPYATIDFVEECKKLMQKKGIPIFILSNTRVEDVWEAIKDFKGEWEKFVKHIVSGLLESSIG